MSRAILALGATIAVLAAIFSPLERLAPMRPQRLLRRALGTDLLFLLASLLLWTPPVLLALDLVARAVDRLPLAALRRPYHAQPAWLQIVEAMLISDCCIYWSHRLSHRLPLLWRFHRVHHTAEELDWVAAYREHPIDNLLTRLVENLPLIVLGAPFAMLAGLVAFRGLWALFIHSNVDLPLGPLRFVLGSPRLHHWHHEPGVGARSNFANLDPLMDLLFGTYAEPDGKPAAYGIAGEPRRRFLALVLRPSARAAPPDAYCPLARANSR